MGRSVYSDCGVDELPTNVAEVSPSNFFLGDLRHFQELPIEEVPLLDHGVGLQSSLPHMLSVARQCTYEVSNGSVSRGGCCFLHNRL